MAVLSSLKRNDSVTVSPIRVLIVDDSAVARAALSRVVGESTGFEIAAALDGARRAIGWLANNAADIVLLDIQMPGLDGLAALPALIEASGGARILVVSTLAGDGARATIRALALGAADTLAKPDIGGLGRHFGDLLLDKMLRLGKARPAALTESRERQLLRAVAETPIGCLAIGASTGGLHALAAFFANLPQEFDAPILVTQHLPPIFMPFFADQLSALSGRSARVARDGETVKRGDLLVAPGDRHLALVRRGKKVCTVLLDQAAVSRCCPSVDPMFSAAAEVYRDDAVGVVLTGMGRDGEIGAGAIAAAGGTIIVQDPVSSAVWGMPGTVARAGLASLIATPSALATYVVRRGVAR
jgi:two-component system, chemotaxis family, protein-glutamate methylesterase/glutaminase